MSEVDTTVDSVLSAFPATEAVYRFGSWGTVWQRSESDLDLAFLLPYELAHRVDQSEWIRLNGEIAQVSRTDRVDLVNLRTATTDLQAEVLRTGEVLYCRDDDARLAFETLILKMHQELNQRRAGLYEDIMKRGRVIPA